MIESFRKLNPTQFSTNSSAMKFSAQKTRKKHIDLFLSALVSVSFAALLSVPAAAQQPANSGDAEQFIEQFLQPADSSAQPAPPAEEAAPVEGAEAASPEGAPPQDVLVPVPPREAPPMVAEQPAVNPDITGGMVAAPTPEPTPAPTPAPSENPSPAPVAVNAQPPAEDSAFSVPKVPAVPQVPNPDEGLFFDSESVVPTGQIATKGTIRNVSPRTEPASKYVVVSRKEAAGTQNAKLVSAQRALNLGRYDSALELYNELYAKNPKDQAVLMGRAVALQKLGRTDAAVQSYQELLDINPNNTQASVNMLGMMGQRYPAVALRRLLEIKSQNPSDVSVLAQLAIIEANTGRYDEALKYLGIASGLEPRNASHLYNLAVIADRAGEKKMAVQYYEQALEVDAIHGGSRSVPRESIFSRLAQIR